jgi:predicted RNA-binding Zn-ribbon protein involved in translation (DUF1610 family)
VGRRGTKEYRAPEALQLVLADRDRQPLTCPSCGSDAIERTPRRRLRTERWEADRQVSLRCADCGRHAAYVPKALTQPSELEIAGI